MGSKKDRAKERKSKQARELRQPCLARVTMPDFDASALRDRIVIGVWTNTLPAGVEQDLKRRTTSTGTWFSDLTGLHNQYLTALTVLAEAGLRREDTTDIDPPYADKMSTIEIAQGLLQADVPRGSHPFQTGSGDADQSTRFGSASSTSQNAALYDSMVALPEPESEPEPEPESDGDSLEALPSLDKAFDIFVSSVREEAKTLSIPLSDRLAEVLGVRELLYAIEAEQGGMPLDGVRLLRGGRELNVDDTRTLEELRLLETTLEQKVGLRGGMSKRAFSETDRVVIRGTVAMLASKSPAEQADFLYNLGKRLLKNEWRREHGIDVVPEEADTFTTGTDDWDGCPPQYLKANKRPATAAVASSGVPAAPAAPAAALAAALAAAKRSETSVRAWMSGNVSMSNMWTPDEMSQQKQEPTDAELRGACEEMCSEARDHGGSGSAVHIQGGVH